jgi:hypothetical protein
LSTPGGAGSPLPGGPLPGPLPGALTPRSGAPPPPLVLSISISEFNFFICSNRLVFSALSLTISALVASDDSSRKESIGLRVIGDLFTENSALSFSCFYNLFASSS